MGFTEEQKYENYLTLQRSIQNLRSGSPITDDWEQLHHDFFKTIRMFFVDFNYVVNPSDDEELRTKCSEAERLAEYTEKYIEQTGRMDYVVYKLFLERLLYIAEYSMEDDEISELMGKLGM